ncbi:hypothetical protein [Methylobacterium oryzisoli]|uniref:hypothetical protein n=1 Tax=Methylobacterium oryzisoli TaxID=3385502 RepID=UPI003891C0E7
MDRERGRRWGAIWGTMGIGLAFAVPLGLAAMPGGPVVAVLGPRGDAGRTARIVAQAGGAILRAGAAGNLLVARSDAPGFTLRLYAAGAWLVLDPILAGGCEPPPRPRAPTEGLPAS